MVEVVTRPMIDQDFFCSQYVAAVFFEQRSVKLDWQRHDCEQESKGERDAVMLDKWKNNSQCCSCRCSCSRC